MPRPFMWGLDGKGPCEARLISFVSFALTVLKDMAGWTPCPASALNIFERAGDPALPSKESLGSQSFETVADGIPPPGPDF